MNTGTWIPGLPEIIMRHYFAFKQQAHRNTEQHRITEKHEYVLFIYFTSIRDMTRVCMYDQVIK